MSKKSVARLLTYSGLLVAATILASPAATAVASVAGSLVASSWEPTWDDIADRLAGEAGALQKRDLTQAAGKAVSAVLGLLAKEQFKAHREKLRLMAAGAAGEEWLEVIGADEYERVQAAGDLIEVLDSGEVLLSEAQWHRILRRLEKKTPVTKDTGWAFFPPETIENIAAELRLVFPSAFRKVLQEDFGGNGRAFADIVLDLLLQIRGEVCQGLSEQVGQQLDVLQSTLQEGEAATQAEMNRLLQAVETGFEGLVQRLGGTETTVQALVDDVKQFAAQLDRLQAGQSYGLAMLREIYERLCGEGTEASNPIPSPEKLVDALEAYEVSYVKRHGELKVLGMSKPVPLTEVYTSVRILSAAEVKNFAGIEELEANFAKGDRRRFWQPTCEMQAGLEAANSEQYLTVLGGPGIGKSTYLRKMGLEALRRENGEYEHCLTPVFLELKKFRDPDLNIEAEIVREFQTCGFPYAEDFTRQALLGGTLLILFDGLDEVPTANLDVVIEAIGNFADCYSKNRFIASCRIAAYHNYFRRFTDVAIAEFDDEQIEQFIVNWFQSELDREVGIAAQCWELLQSEAYKAAKDLARTPLLLTYLCLVYDKTQSLPRHRSTLYGKALDIILEEWASEKRIRREKIYEGLHGELEKELLADIAYQSFERNELFFEKADLIGTISGFISETLDVPPTLDGKSVLTAIEVQQGILVERAENIYSFSHLTLQEYLTAQYITSEGDSLKTGEGPRDRGAVAGSFFARVGVDGATVNRFVFSLRGRGELKDRYPSPEGLAGMDAVG